jgi:hypothetical protein
MAAFLWGLLTNSNNNPKHGVSPFHKDPPPHHSSGRNPTPRESGRIRPVPTNELSIGGKAAWWFEEIAQEKYVMQSERRERAEARVVVHIEEDEERSRRCRLLKVQLELEAQERKDLLEQVKRMEDTERSRY